MSTLANEDFEPKNGGFGEDDFPLQLGDFNVSHDVPC